MGQNVASVTPMVDLDPRRNVARNLVTQEEKVLGLQPLDRPLTRGSFIVHLGAIRDVVDRRSPVGAVR
jgi:hypothetical protein